MVWTGGKREGWPVVSSSFWGWAAGGNGRTEKTFGFIIKLSWKLYSIRNGRVLNLLRMMIGTLVDRLSMLLLSFPSKNFIFFYLRWSRD